MNRWTNIRRPWRRATTIIAAAGLLVSCGGGDDATTSADTEPVSDTAASTTNSAVASSPPTATAEPATGATETTTAAPDGTTASTSAGDASGGGVGRAVVEVDADRYEFVVIQCLRDVTGPLSDAVIEFQLDGVPAATPPDVVKRLLGVIGEDVDVFAELEPVVEFGPILSITQLAGGGEAFYVTDLDTIEITSDGDPTDPASRSLDVSPDTSGARVTGTSTAAGRSVTVDATCP